MVSRLWFANSSLILFVLVLSMEIMTAAFLPIKGIGVARYGENLHR